MMAFDALSTEQLQAISATSGSSDLHLMLDLNSYHARPYCKPMFRGVSDATAQ